MSNVPEHIINMFELDNKSYPCISHIKIKDFNILNTLLNKSSTIWYFTNENYDKRVTQEEFALYDKTGIYIYYKQINNNEYDVFLLSKIDKRDIVDFTLHIIKKQNKTYGNNSERITGKD